MSQPSSAQTASSAAPGASAAAFQRADRLEVYVPYGGGSVEVPIHPWELCVLSFSEEMSKEALSSVKDFALQDWSADAKQIAMQAKVDPASSGQTGSFALVSTSGNLKINVTFRVVPKDKPVARYVYFRTVTLDELVEARVQDRMATLRKNLEPEILARADQAVIDRALIRLEKVEFAGVKERNNDNVVATLQQSLLLGDVGYLFFTLRNRGTAPFRISRLAVTRSGSAIPVEVKLYSASADKDPKMIGVVLPDKTARGVVVIPNVTPLLKRSLSLEFAGFKGQGAFSIPEIVLK
ncbi:MAG: hypothetical protein HC863_00515 [Myxococcales bacterium]|nr:hypothetical protein [Myxococcales bacterium]